MAAPACAPKPDLHIPRSPATVSVSIIDTKANISGMPTAMFLTPTIKGNEILKAAVFSFLIHHPTKDRTLLFDLGISKTWDQNPVQKERYSGPQSPVTIDVPTDVREILESQGQDVSRVEAVIWSHWHFDHTGDPSRFPPTTSLVVGPGFKEAMLPGYPADPTSTLLESDFAGREVREIGREEFTQPIGRFRAFDYFGDGSFYLLDAPGHAVGHMCGLARVTAASGSGHHGPGHGHGHGGDSFILMGGDAAHHGGEMRPSAFLPLPHSIVPNPFTDSPVVPFCPGEMFDAILPGPGDHTKPFYQPTEQGVHLDVAETKETIAKLQEADCADDVLVALAHDAHLLGVVDFYPAKLDDFVEKGWVRKTRWRFLRDFAEAVGYQGEESAGQ